jgi:hypothetical protein
MSTYSIAPLPDRATFVRDQLADHLDGLGHVIEAQDERDGFPCLSVEHANGSAYMDLAVVDARGDGPVRLMSMVDGWKPVVMRGFVWHTEPRDTGMVHGPKLPTASQLNDWPYRYPDSGVRCYTGPYINRSGFRIDPDGRTQYRIPGTTRTR